MIFMPTAHFDAWDQVSLTFKVHKLWMNFGYCSIENVHRGKGEERVFSIKASEASNQNSSSEQIDFHSRGQ